MVLVSPVLPATSTLGCLLDENTVSLTLLARGPVTWNSATSGNVALGVFLDSSFDGACRTLA